ncbi:MAG: hypothetical protein ABI306_04170 [Caulobacteraceae bacterium]
MNMDEMLTLTHATERDVDLLLIEEMKCSPAFVRWFVGSASAKLRLKLPCEGSSVSHSKRRIHNRREIDITLAVRGAGRRTTLLIENKLDTSEQPRQAESYREESAVMVARRETDAAYTVLVCPEAYARSSNSFSTKFDCQISYESVAAFLLERVKVESGELSARLAHRHELVHQAITKARRGYEAVPMVQIEAFNAKYVALIRKVKIDLEPGSSMLREGRPGESKTMIFAPTALPNWGFLPQTRLVHQLREGNANINFYTWGNHFSHLAGAMAPALVGTRYRLVPTVNKRLGGNSGLMIVADTPAVDNLRGFEEQQDAILEGIRVTADLRAWFWKNKAMIAEWAKIAGSMKP